MRAALALLLLTACGAQPTPALWGATSRTVTQDGRSYGVAFTDKSFEIIRLGWASPGQHQAIRAAMLDIVPEVTGCRIDPERVQGDSGEIRGALLCPR